ncbi:MAG TPA: hypothetical protein VJP76_01200 [Candidatus Tumulicola sp.]|nr:hypothetical protein [Candidatus Tumulicola sp.]
MSSSIRVSWTRVVVAGVAAGIAGAVTFDLYLWATTLVPAHQSVATLWQWIASTAFGKGALTDPAYAAAGAALHAIVSIGWALGFAYVAAVNPTAARRWLLAGPVYGIVVYTIMQTILLADNNFIYPPNPNAFVNDVVAHAVFFGLPVAYVVQAMLRRPS